MTMPPMHPPNTPPPRRPAYFQGGIGWLYTLAIIVVIWLIVGLLLRPGWWPWWW